MLEPNSLRKVSLTLFWLCRVAVQVEQRLGTSKGGIETLKAHDWFVTAGLDWQKLLAKEVTRHKAHLTPTHHHIPPFAWRFASCRGSIPREICASQQAHSWWLT